MRKDDELKPKGGCACATSIGECECRYCAAIITRVMSHDEQKAEKHKCRCRACRRLPNACLTYQTCADCAEEWTAAFGPRWFEEPWHTELDAEFAALNPIMYHGIVPLSKIVSISEENVIEETSHPDMRKWFYPAYCAMKDILIVMHAARSSAIIAATGVNPNDARLQALQGIGTALGPAKMRALLVVRGFKDDGGAGLLSIPSDDVLHKYLRSIREEIGDYVPMAEIIEFPQKRARNTFEDRVMAVA